MTKHTAAFHSSRYNLAHIDDEKRGQDSCRSEIASIPHPQIDFFSTSAAPEQTKQHLHAIVLTLFGQFSHWHPTTFIASEQAKQHQPLSVSLERENRSARLNSPSTSTAATEQSMHKQRLSVFGSCSVVGWGHNSMLTSVNAVSYYTISSIHFIYLRTNEILEAISDSVVIQIDAEIILKEVESSLGAGISGLYATKRLRDLGLSHLVLEASDRHGGRVHSVEHVEGAPYPLELGAEWVHGQNSEHFKPIQDLVGKEHVHHYDEKRFKQVYTLGAGVSHTYPPYWDKHLEKMEKFIDNLYKYSGEDVCIHDYVSTHLNFPATHSHLLDTWLGAEFGGSLQTLGMASLGISENLWKCGEKDFVLCAPYLRTLIEAFGLQSILPAVQYGKVVCAVEYGNDRCVVRCADGSAYTCDHAIIAVPLSILKLSLSPSPCPWPGIAFHPPLPPAHSRAIGSLGMEAGVKLVLFFRRRFWGAEVCELTLQVEGNAGGGCFVHDPWFFKRQCKAHQQTHAGYAEALFPLSFFVTGRLASTSAASPAAESHPLVAALLSSLDMYFAPAQASSSFAHRALLQDWGRQEFVRGCYSCPAVGSYRSAKDHARLDLARPVTQAYVREQASASSSSLAASHVHLVFAGEAASANHPSTVHGALEAAANAVQRIVESRNARHK
eukprot:gene24440-29542_t